jgi:outer membrane receptor protein involved in Fe transport
MRVRTAFVLLLLLAWSASPAFAQTETGRLTGTVTDPQDRAVPGVNVTATSTASGVVRSAVTDTNGQFVIANLQPSPYELKFSLQGFKAVTMNITVQVGQSVGANAKLEIGGMTETVTVSASATETVNTINAEVSTVVKQEQIRELPNVERNPYSLVQIAGNVQDVPVEEVQNNSDRGVGFNINGGRSAGTSILLDGTQNSMEFTAEVGQDVPLDSVQEFSVITNNFSAQYGRATGGVVNLITKSGTNMFQGTAYTFYRTEKLASNTPDNIANNTPKGQFTRNQPGFSIGGPIIKDKLHFFSSMEFAKIESSDTLFTWVPTSQFLAASSAATRAYFSAFDKGVAINGPILTRADVSGIIGTGAGAFSQLPGSLPVFGRVDRVLPIDAGGGLPGTDRQFVNRLDWSMGPSTQFYVRYAYQNSETDPGTFSASPYPGFDTGQTDNNHNLLGSMTRVWSPSMTSQTKIAYTRVWNEQPTNGGPPSPRLMMNPNGNVQLQGYNILFPGYLPDSPSADIPAGGPQATTQLFHDQTWLRGKHDIRFGGSFIRMADDHTFSAYSNAVEFLNTASTITTSLDNFVTGNIARFQAAINPNGFPGGTFTTPVPQPSFLSNNRYNEFAFYLQDNFRATPRLTLNFGLRYDYYGPQSKKTPKYDSNFYYGNPDLDITTASPSAIIDAVRTGSVKLSKDSPTGTLWKKDMNNFAPRLGFAYDLNGDGKTSIRGGYGISYERNFGNVTYNVLFNPPLYLVSTIDAPTDVASLPIYVDNAGPFGGVAGVVKPIPTGSLRHVDQNIVNAYYHQYGASMQRELAPGWAGSLEYNGSTGRKLYDLADINKRGSPLVYQGVGTGSTRPNPQYAAFNTRGNRAQSQYHGVTFGLDSRGLTREGLSFNTKYTISKAQDNLSSTFGDGNNGGFNLGYLNPFDPMLDYGNAEFDVRHRLLTSAIWNVPFLRDSTGMKRAILGGWTITGIFTARTGYPFTVFDCTNGRDACMRALDTAGGISKNANGNTATGNPNEFVLLDLSPIVGLAGTYVDPLTGTSDYGPYPSTMTKRDAFRAPGAWFFDFGMSKRFRISDRRAFQFRLDVFNLFNHSNLLANTAGADVSSATQITGYRDGHRRAQIGFRFEY